MKFLTWVKEMKVMRKRIPAREQISYECSKCNTWYFNRKNVLACEALLVEKKFFKIGDRVTWREVRTCQIGGNYYLDGRVVKVSKPSLVDWDYNIRWLGGRLSRVHCRVYTVVWTCLFCKQEQGGEFYGIELMGLNGEITVGNRRETYRLLKKNNMFPEQSR